MPDTEGMKLAALKSARGAWWAAAIIAGVVVFFCHFRPWEVGLLEEWGFADSVNRHGWSVFVDPSFVELGRPLQNLVVFVALAPGLGILGIQLMLGVVAVGQFVVVLRFGSRDGLRPWLALIVALVFALHPLWPAGFILRYLCAQIAILGTIAAISLIYRYLHGARAWLLLPSAVLVVAALLTYQAPAAVLPLAALALSVMIPAATVRRRWLATVVIVAAVAATTLWSTVIAQKLAPSGATYESSLLGISGGGGALQTVKTILRSVAQIPVTLTSRAPATVIAVVVLLVILFALHRSIGMSRRVTWTLAVLTILSLVMSAPYAVNPIHVLDPERVGGPAALTLEIVVMLWCLLSPERAVPLQTAVAAGLLVATAAATAISLTYWGRYSGIQRSLLTLIAPAVTQATGHQRVLIEDGSGVLGDVYTGFPADLSSSSHVFNSDPTNVVMCTIDGITQRQPVAAIFPLTTIKYCSAVKRPNAQLVTRGEIAGGPVKVYIIGTPTG